tara:strand:- start:40154 stop:45211 length:5058 start_codon:yes stop_codon:yes gene_type:complete
MMSRNENHFFKSFNCKKFAVMTFGILFLLTGCVESPKTSRRSKTNQGASTGTTPPVGTPIFTNSLNYFQSGTTKSTSVFDQSVFTSDTYYLRGKNIDLFVKAGNTSTVQCIVHHYPASVTNQVLVLAATPQSFNNFTTNTLEHYYLVKPNDSTTNQTFCQKPGILSAMASAFPGQSVVYRIADVCPSCNLSSFSSDSSRLRTSGGVVISGIDISYLSLRLQNTTVIDPGTVSCSGSSECVAQGFDCCLSGQCVVDASIKSTTDTNSSEFLQSVDDIANAPSSINNYPHLYNICPVIVTPNPTPTPTPNPQEEAAARLLSKKELYDCINPVNGEQGFCTSIYDVATDTSGSYETGADDLNFNTIYTGSFGLPMHSIDKVTYGGVALFQNGAFTQSGVTLNGLDNGVPPSNLNGNDDLTNPVTIGLTGAFVRPGNADEDLLRIRYKADSSCERLGPSIARCKKFFTQGQNLGLVNDHFPASNEFKLPIYADTSKQIKVEVDGSTRYQGTHWSLMAGSPAKVVFNGSNLAVFDTQVVLMTYYVNLGTWPVLGGVEIARDRIRDMCDCVGEGCNLEPVTNNQGAVVDYSCVYPDNTSPPPLQQTVLMTSKTVPVRYFDGSGVPQTELNGSTPAQEGVVFEYTSSNLAKPNNVGQYIGFNEIYGSISTAARSAKPAKEVRIAKGKTYDIFVDQGAFSTCYYCGNDSWNSALKLFPQNFNYKGGGYLPNPFETNQKTSSTYRSDDLIFGRACFLPVTMIPWSHRGTSDRQDQRQRRLQAQHFFFANGYQRDWYGFDYGSVIGSFDGITWFSVGNQRRVQAESNKLFLAVNAYFGDQTDENTFSVTVSDAAAVPGSGSIITSDFESDGAECQQYHVCDTDRDCAAQLGWEYSCQSVTGLKALWPSIDENGLETPESETLKTLSNILVGNLTGGTKRCVYRGRGAACMPNFDNIDLNSSYTKNATDGLHACAPNTYCQRLVEGSVNAPKFNNSIARWARSPAFQNISTDVIEDELDEFGKHTRIIGRSQKYVGDEPVLDITKANLFHNDVTAMCLPGKNPVDVGNSLLTFGEQNAEQPTTSSIGGDRVLGIGVTRDFDSIEGIAACPVFDSSGRYFQMEQTHISLLPSSTLTGDDSPAYRLPAQNLSTDLLDKLNMSNTVVRDFINDQITKPALEEFRCLRAPGATCHTNMDCAPNNLIATKLAGIDPKNPPPSTPLATLNRHEIMYWQEELVCKQAVAYPDNDFELKNNRCCREDNKKVTIATHYANYASIPAADQPEYPNVAPMDEVLGLNKAKTDDDRYTRWNTVVDLVKDGSSNQFKPLSAPIQNQQTFNISDFNNQYETFGKIAARTCCGGHWVRQFHQSNGGGHQWTPARHQSNIKARSLGCYNWFYSAAAPNAAVNHQCDATIQEPDDIECTVKDVTQTQADDVLAAISNLELAGIPQAYFIDNSNITNANLRCSDRPASVIGFASSFTGTGIDLTIPSAGGHEATDGAENYYSLAAALFDAPGAKVNFNDSQIKPVFSQDEVSCCKPAGTLVPANADANLCCTGSIRNINAQFGKCALPDYTNVSVHMNRYVSSVAKDLDPSLIDGATGFIEDPAVVEQLACQLDVCASGVLARGVSYVALPVPGKQDTHPDFTTRRFVEGNQAADNGNGILDLWNAGMRWNNHVYCAPAQIPADSPDLIVTPCF